jgi:hypothetical protein
VTTSSTSSRDAPLHLSRHDADVPKGSAATSTSSGSFTGGGSTPAADEKARAARLQDARDAVELLEAQLQVKEAQLVAVKPAFEAARARLGRVTALHRSGAVTEAVVEQAKSDYEAARAQLAIREAELREPAVRLAQAKRRLAALAPAPPPAPKPAAKPAAADGQRLRELERKLDALRKEVEELRRAVRPPK